MTGGSSSTDPPSGSKDHPPEDAPRRHIPWRRRDIFRPGAQTKHLRKHVEAGLNFAPPPLSAHEELCRYAAIGLPNITYNKQITIALSQRSMGRPELLAWLKQEHPEYAKPYPGYHAGFVPFDNLLTALKEGVDAGNLQLTDSKYSLAAPWDPWSPSSHLDPSAARPQPPPRADPPPAQPRAMRRSVVEVFWQSVAAMTGAPSALGTGGEASTSSSAPTSAPSSSLAAASPPSSPPDLEEELGEDLLLRVIELCGLRAALQCAAVSKRWRGLVVGLLDRWRLLRWEGAVAWPHSKPPGPPNDRADGADGADGAEAVGAAPAAAMAGLAVADAAAAAAGASSSSPPHNGTCGTIQWQVPEEFKPDNLTYVQLQPGAGQPWGEETPTTRQWELQPTEDRIPSQWELQPTEDRIPRGGTLWACYRSAHRIAAFDAAEMCARGGRTGVSAAGKPRVGTAPARFSFGGNDEEGTIPPFPADEWHSRVMASRRKRGALSSPCAFTVSERRVYVCDRENHRISVFSADDGAYRHCFSTFGDAPGCAFTPEGESRAILCPPGGKQPMLRGLCVGPRGRIYAADRCNDLIHLIQLRR
ncbi:hypothetical protein EMIHUDRAFT_469777 [Emiliania huxleyi CCMP1516]|uniref:F-box domain-containing protein n=2 Tax=Emiliania huxleyi TaxID=2903 RepID=A0A0D3JDE0_EMIH1|nr:hypothetical protein EMIHUDRAFT_469777 [Emiliania huxleyi CCMP1516]EOD21525.1 hypothetical protein EMIHUDRAFT_469777 [Emiliania huxleyi CCMP1516]|eukprot:XP_005773954.1 hypothetical protein EMIHUDRAFT_469777 [Emiliania huxleyi CCMP1516]